MTGSSAWAIVESVGSSRLALSDTDAARMNASADRLAEALAADAPVYGLTSGFGPLARFPAGVDDNAQGLNLVHHLAAGQGPPLDVATTRLTLGLRLAGMKRGYSGITPASWSALAEVFNAGFTPVVPAKGSVSASGDLLPLAHAALAFAGHGHAWRVTDGEPVVVPAAEELTRLGLRPVRWGARDALAFVNGSSASLAAALRNHVALVRSSWAAAVLTGRLVDVFGASTEPYADDVVDARGGFPGHARAVEWIRTQLSDETPAAKARALQEPYSLRCAPQVIGSVLDQLWSGEELLVREAEACSDNPVISATAVLHAGNFHAVNTGLVSDQHAVLAHQLAFLAERQLALVVEPASNGGLPALLASTPGATSGLAGVQIAASAMVSEVRQKALPATTTALPTNLSNQDIVPMSLVGALRTAEQVELVELVVASLGLAAAQAQHALGLRPVTGLWAEVLAASPRLAADRPLSTEVHRVRDLLGRHATDALASTGGHAR